MNQYRAEHADSLNSLGPYLNYDSLIDGVNQILSHLGLRFTRVEAGRHEIWCGGVYKYVLSTGDAGGAGAGGSSLRDGSVPPETDPSTVGILYIDPFPRQHKKVQSAQFTLKGSKILDYEVKSSFVVSATSSSPVPARTNVVPRRDRGRRGRRLSLSHHLHNAVRRILFLQTSWRFSVSFLSSCPRGSSL